MNLADDIGQSSPSPSNSYTLIPLLPSPDDELVAEILRAALGPSKSVFVRVATMPLTGLDFFTADGEAERQLNLVWGLRVPEHSRPILLLLHHPNLPEYLEGIDAELVIGMEGGDLAGCYADHSGVEVVASTDPRVIAEAALQKLQGLDVGTRDASSDEGVLGNDQQLFDALFGNHPPAPKEASLSSRQQLPADPLVALANAMQKEDPSLPSEGESLAPSPPPEPPWWKRWWLFLAGHHEAVVPEDIANLLLGVSPAPVVVVGARKGGVGKTAFSAGLAQVCGYSLDGRSGIAALVDQNINNADQWGRLMVKGEVKTVRQIMAALESGEDFPPPPTYARTPALAVYPESRDPGDGYPAALVERFVSNLRRRHVFSVVDLPNTLPAYTSAEAAVAAAYIEQADLVIVPTTDDPNALRGVLEYLQVPSMRGKRVVVPYIVSPEREIRENQGVQDLLSQIRDRAAAVITFPKTEKATLAIVQGTSILEVDANLKEAYVKLALVVARMLLREPV